MANLTDLVVEANPKILKLLSVCNLSKNVDHCDVPYRKVLVTKIRELLNDIWYVFSEYRDLMYDTFLSVQWLFCNGILVKVMSKTNQYTLVINNKSRIDFDYKNHHLKMVILFMLLRALLIALLFSKLYFIYIWYDGPGAV